MVRTTIDAMQGNRLVIHQHRSITGHNLFRFTRARLYGLLVFLVCVLGSVEGLGQTVVWDFTTAAPSTSIANITTSNLTQGNNNGTTTLITNTSASSGYTGASGGNNAGAAARVGAINTGASGSAYFEFTLTPAAGYSFSLTAISFGSRETGTGPKAYTLRSSSNSYGSDLTTGVLPASSSWFLYTNTGLSISSSSVTTFRIYGYNGTGSPSAGTANWRVDDISLTITITATCSTPTTEVSSIGFSSIISTSANISWTNGNGSNRAVFVSQTSTGTPSPVNNTTYTANTSFGMGSQIGSSGWYCVYNGTGSSVSVSGLSPSTTYRAMVVEYNCTTGSEKYLTTATAGNIENFTTASASSPNVTMSVASLTDFGSICTGQTSSSQSYNVAGTNLTSDIVITPPSGFQIKKSTDAVGAFSSSAINLTPTAGTVASTGIDVRFAPSATGVVSLNVTNTSTGATQKDLIVSGTGINSTATIGSPTSTSITTTTATLGGNITVIGCSNVTERGIYWSTTSGFADGAGSKVSTTGSFGTGFFTQAVTGLPGGTTVYFKAFATNSGGTVYTTQSSFTTLKTEPTNFPTSFACGTTTTNSIPLTWTDAVGATLPDGYLVKWSSVSYAAITDPTDGTAVANGANAQNITQGAQSYTASGLTAATTYYFKIWSYTNTGTNIDYKLTSQPQTSCVTKDAPCFTEDFASASSGDNTTTTGQVSTWSGNSNFTTVVSANQAGGAIKLGSSSASGSITSAALSGVSGNVTLFIDVKGWTTVEGDLTVTLNGIAQTITYTATMSSAFETKTLSFLGVPAGATLKIETSAKRAFIDNINLYCTPVAPTPEINLKQNTTSIASGSGSYNFGNRQVSTSSAATSFTIENMGTATLTLSGSPRIAISGTNAADFSINQASTAGTIAASGSTSFSVTFTPSAAGSRTATISIANDDADENPYTFTITGTGTYAATSTITENSTSYNNGTPSTKIEYLTYQSTPGIGSSVSGTIGVLKFRINDIGGDGQPTIATELRFTVKDESSTNQISQIRHAVLATTSNSIKGVATISGTELVFSSLPATDFTTATDDGSAKYIEYILRVSYKSDNNIVDNSKFVFKVSSATASTAGSVFAASDAGGATSDASTDNRNRINVTADRLRFTTQPVDQAVNTNLVAFTVKAVDANNNVDADIFSTFTLTTSGTGMTSSSPYALASGSKTISDVQFNAVQGPITLTATTSGLSFDNDDISSSFSIVNVTSGSYRTTGAGTWNGTATWERFTAGWVSSSAPTSGNTTDMIYIRHAVSFVGSMSFGKITIESGGKLTNPSSGNISGNLLVQSGGTLQVNGSLTVSGSFEVEDNGIVNLNHNFLSPSSSIWAGTENFHPSSNLVIQYWDFSQNLIASNTTVTANTYSGYTACFGNISIDVGSNTTSWNMLPSGFSVNLGHGNLSFLSNAANVNLATTGTVTTGIGGNFNIDNAYTGSNYVTLKTSGTSNFTVKGSVQLDAATLRILAGSTAGSSSTLNIEGDLNISPSAVLDFNTTVAGGSPAPLPIVNLKGDLSVASSGLLRNSNTSNVGQFNFNGVGDGTTSTLTQTIDIASTGVTENSYIAFTIKSSAYVQLANRNLEIGNSSSISVEAAAVLDFSFSGSTALVLKEVPAGASSTSFSMTGNAKIIITHQNGIDRWQSASDRATDGNVQISGSRNFSSTGIYHYKGKAPQQRLGDGILFGGISGKYVIVELDALSTQLLIEGNAGTSTTTFSELTDVGLSSSGNGLKIIQGTVVGTSSSDFMSTGNLEMTGGLYRIAYPASLSVVPRLSGTYTLTGGTIELYGTLAQTLRGGNSPNTPNYYNLKMSGSNTVKINSTPIEVTQKLEIVNTAIFDIESNSMTGTAGLTMSGGRLRMSQLGTTLPAITGTATPYVLTNGTVEFYGSGSTQQQRIRGNYGASSTQIAYYNVDVNAASANYSSISGAGNANLNSSFKLAGTMNVNIPAVLRIDKNESITSNTGSGDNFVVNAGAGLLYGGSEGTTSSPIEGLEASGIDINSGNIRTASRSFSTGASYGFIGAGDMPTGSGLPTTVAGLYAFKTNTTDLVTFTNPALVSGSGSVLNLTSGVLVTTSTNLVTLKPEAVVIGGSSSSFVSGPLAKQTDATNTPVGTYEFTFPIGKTSPSSQYKPAYVLPATASGTTTYTAEYFPANPAVVYNQAFLENLMALYKYNYWKIDRGNLETGTARVALDYSPGGAASDWVLQGGLTSLATISSFTNVAITKNFSTYWSFTKSSGNFNNVGPMYEARHYTSSGKIYSGILNSFSPFTFGYSYNVILPVKLLAFTGRLMNADGLLEWSIADARDLDGFELEYSTDGSSYQSLAKIGSNGSVRYSFLHKKLPAGTNYYRLLVKEKGGNQYYSQVVMLNMGKLKTYVIGLAPTVVGTQLTTAIFAANAQKLQARINDVLGRQLWTGSKNLAAGTNQWNIDTHDLPKGLYFISLETRDGLKETLRFIKE